MCLIHSLTSHGARLLTVPADALVATADSNFNTRSCIMGRERRRCLSYKIYTLVIVLCTLKRLLLPKEASINKRQARDSQGFWIWSSLIPLK